MGTTTAECMKYTSGTGVSKACPTKCDNGSEITTIVKSKSYKNVCTDEESIKAALLDGPLTTGFNVYLDFELY